MDDQTAALLAQVQAELPDLPLRTIERLSGDNQFNDILIINETLIVRFPRHPQAVATLTREVAVLRRLQGRLPLPIPNPTLTVEAPESATVRWMAYPRIPGEPLWDDELHALPATAQQQIARQLAGFLQTLHALPIGAFGADLPVRDEAQHWDALFAAFRAELYPFMRPDAQSAIDALHVEIMADLRARPPYPALIHGDFGGGNILYDPATHQVTGVIDFGSVAIGDPAIDIAALSCYGEAVVAHGALVYPAIATMLPRARLYQATFALQQALWAIRAGDAAAFADGIATYR